VIIPDEESPLLADLTKAVTFSVQLGAKNTQRSENIHAMFCSGLRCRLLVISCGMEAGHLPRQARDKKIGQEEPLKTNDLRVIDLFVL
jgi:hypothetical protein